MIKLFRNTEDKISLTAPCKGQIIPLNQVKDAMFANKVLGDGFALIPEDDVICAPCCGRIMMIASTAHAFGIKLKNGAEILVHIGLDTVNLNGKGFTLMMHMNQKVKQGMPLLKIDRTYMVAQSLDLTVPVILMNDDQHELVHHVCKGEANCNLTIASVVSR